MTFLYLIFLFVLFGFSFGKRFYGTTVTCYDMGGRRKFRVMLDPGACTLDVNTSQWGSGVYLLNISRQTINSSFKIVVNR